MATWMVLASKSLVNAGRSTLCGDLFTQVYQCTTAVGRFTCAGSCTWYRRVDRTSLFALVAFILRAQRGRASAKFRAAVAGALVRWWYLWRFAAVVRDVHCFGFNYSAKAFDVRWFPICDFLGLYIRGNSFQVSALWSSGFKTTGSAPMAFSGRYN